MTLSVIDIGTNTILMATLAVRRDGGIDILGDEHEIARLGKGVDASRRILPETFDRVAGYLDRYRAIAESLDSERIVAFGTSALRDAANRGEFIAAMRERTGIIIELLSGEEEAHLTYRGALFGHELGDGRHAVLDIGGGSTELAYGSRGKLERGASIDIGAVRITERFLSALPPDSGSIEAARRFAASMLAPLFDLPADAEVVGVAGTVTTLGAMAIGMPGFDADELNGTRLGSDEIGRITAELCAMPLESIAAIPQVHPARADILPGGAIILDEFMQRYDLPEIIVSTRGVRYGVALREIERGV
jgi:exopolyphosphatase/guanosine-5'-triphosphate,3'-diphosphate pyrophosphatase